MLYQTDHPNSQDQLNALAIKSLGILLQTTEACKIRSNQPEGHIIQALVQLDIKNYFMAIVLYVVISGIRMLIVGFMAQVAK